MKMRAWMAAGLFGIAALVPGAVARAVPLLAVDFGQTGVSSAPTGTFQGINFSPFQGTLSTTATTSNTYATSAGNIQVTVSNQDGFYQRGGTANNGAFTYANLYNSFVYRNTTVTAGAGGPVSLNVSLSGAGIQPNTPYSLTFYSYDFGPVGPPQVSEGTHAVTITGTGTTAGAPATITYNSTTPPTSNNQYSGTSTFTSDASGTLSFQVSDTFTGSADGSTGVRLNALALQSIPEPGSLSLLALAVAGLLPRRGNR